MKRIFYLMLFLILLPGLVWAQEEGRHWNNHGNHHAYRNNQRGYARVSARFRQMGVRSYPHAFNRRQLLIANPNRSFISFPGRGFGGVALHANIVARTNFSTNPFVRTQMAFAMGDSFRAQVRLFNLNEHRVGFYYWHHGNGFSFCHYYDRWGYHWYGWYLNNAFFWTRWYSNRWWWYDPVAYRWCYWYEGGWWWQNPDTQNIYIYNNGNYVPEDENNNINNGPNPNQNDAPSPAQSMGPKKVFYSQDGSREVKLMGSDAFLYDSSGNNSFKPVYLSSNVTNVRFSNSSNGKPLQVMLTLNDGSFALFDGQGNSLSGGNNGSDQNENNPPASNNPPDEGNGNSGGAPPEGGPSGSSVPPNPGN